MTDATALAQWLQVHSHYQWQLAEENFTLRISNAGLTRERDEARAEAVMWATRLQERSDEADTLHPIDQGNLESAERRNAELARRVEAAQTFIDTLGREGWASSATYRDAIELKASLATQEPPTS